jgi:hypothetical protein
MALIYTNARNGQMDHRRSDDPVPPMGTTVTTGCSPRPVHGRAAGSFDATVVGLGGGGIPMAYLQERMVHYLTCDPHLFVAEERMLQYGPDPSKDIWWIDALVADPWRKTFFLGEATYNLRPAPLVRKVNSF